MSKPNRLNSLDLVRGVVMLGGIPLIHLLALGVNYARDRAMHHEWYATAPYATVPEEHQWSLGLLYVIFVVVTMVLYPLCRWFRDYKATHDAAWLRFI